MPLLQGTGQLAADRGVEWLQACPHEGQPWVDPGVDGDSVCQWVPAVHLHGSGQGNTAHPVKLQARAAREEDHACLAKGRNALPACGRHSPLLGRKHQAQRASQDAL